MENGCRDGLTVFPKVVRLEYAEDGMSRMVCGSSTVKLSGDEGGNSVKSLIVMVHHSRALEQSLALNHSPGRLQCDAHRVC